jgi:hypothetical protein
MLCRVVCRRGDIKRLEHPVLNTSSVCGRASVEEEVTIPGHCGILKGDGGGINCTVPEVCEQNINACGAWCQGRMNVFGSIGILDGLDYASEAWRMASKVVIVDNACIVKVCSCPQVVCVNGNFG